MYHFWVFNQCFELICEVFKVIISDNAKSMFGNALVRVDRQRSYRHATFHSFNKRIWESFERRCADEQTCLLVVLIHFMMRLVCYNSEIRDEVRVLFYFL